MAFAQDFAPLVTISAGRAGRVLRIANKIIPMMTEDEMTEVVRVFMRTIARFEQTALEDDENEYGHA